MSLFSDSNGNVPFQRLVVLDPALRSCFGHHYNYTYSVVMAARERGIPTTVVCHYQADPYIIESLGAVPLFRLGTYSEMNVDDSLPNSAFDRNTVCGHNLFYQNLYFLRELNVLSEFLGPTDMLFFHTIMEHQVLAISQWLAGMPTAQRPMTNLLLRFWHIHEPYGTPLLQLCSTVLRNPRMRVSFSTDTVELAALYRDMLQHPIDVLPIPHSPHENNPETSRRFLPQDLSPDTVVVGYLGDTRGNKGFLYLRRLINAMLQNPPRPVHFLVQISVSQEDETVKGEIEALMAMAGPSLTLITETLSIDDYYAAMDSCDVVLISYFARDYLYGSSGIFTEAASAGKVVVIPAGTNMEHECQRFDCGYVSFKDFTPVSIMEALLKAVVFHDPLAEKAKKASAEMQAYHNAPNLIDCLIATAPT